MRAHGRDFAVGGGGGEGVELVIDAICFFGKLCKWLVMMFSEYTIDPQKQILQ